MSKRFRPISQAELIGWWSELLPYMIRNFLRTIAETYPQKILVGIDVKQGFGWLFIGWTTVIEIDSSTGVCFVNKHALGVGIVFTDISKDGMLEGPNISALRQAAESSPVPIIASGGVTALDDIRAIQGLGSNISGVIIGKALYEGTLDLKSSIGTRSTG